MDWTSRKIPADLAASLNALRFGSADLPVKSHGQLTHVISGLSLLLGDVEAIRKNAERVERLKLAYRDVAQTLQAAGIEFVVLKGFAQWARYVAAPHLRPQYDIDLYCPDHAVQARDALLRIGYEPLKELDAFPTDHLPVLIRKTGWQFRGDYFDPDIPYSVELHFRLWDEETEGFGAPGVEEFWSRRTEQQADGIAFLGFHPADGLAYTSLHLLRHLLRGNLQPYHVYELSWFLHRHSRDHTFWQQWQDLHPSELRTLQAISFRLASDWFDCAVYPAAAAEIERLPEDIRAWFDGYAAAPLENLFSPNKHELWLNLSLAQAGKKRRIFLRRLLPARLPGPVDAVHVPESQMTFRLRLRKQWRYFLFVSHRVVYHCRLLMPTVWNGLVWTIGKPFWTFLAASCLFSLGLFVFVLLYNLYLLDLGYKEDFLGLVASAMTIGSIAGTLPAGALIQRIGLRRTIAVSFVGTALVSALRSVAAGNAALLALAFLGGLALSIWPVSIAPAIAHLTPERNRPLAFSFFFSAGIGTGIVGGTLGGRLGASVGKQAGLLIGCGMVLLALWPVSKLRFPATPDRQRAVYPWSDFLVRFLLAMMVWNLATGAFNPFFNAYFARHLHFSVERIGVLFSGAQLAQVVAVLLAPLVLRRFGLVGGIALMQLMTGAGLAGLALGPAGLTAAAAYAGYMSFQWMSEPGMYTLLMNNVKPGQQAGASALNYLVIFSSQAIAATAAGVAITHVGYSWVIGAASAMALVAALFFRLLLGRSSPSSGADSAAA